MAEAVGLALSAAGILSLFTSCLDVLDIIDTASSYGRDMLLMNQLFDNQRYRLVMWANACFGSTANVDKRLSQVPARGQIENNLNCIFLLLEDQSRLQRQFGLTKARQIDNTTVASSRKAALQDSFAAFRASIHRTQKTTPIQKILRWTIRDRKKFLELINFLQTYIDGLWDVTSFISQSNLQWEAMEETMNTLPIEVSQSVAAAASVHGDPLSDAAMARQMRQMGAIDQDASYLPPLNASSSPEAASHERLPGVISVLFVDYGNSCRSPMAEAVFRHLTTNMENIGTIDSAGVGNDFWLKPIDQRSVFTLYTHGITRNTREPRRICPRDFLYFDYILAMDGSTLVQILASQAELPRAIKAGPTIKLFGSFEAGENLEIRDPFFQDFRAFELTFQVLVQLSKAFLRNELEIDTE